VSFCHEATGAQKKLQKKRRVTTRRKEQRQQRRDALLPGIQRLRGMATTYE
jgi:hypothetical protein